MENVFWAGSHEQKIESFALKKVRRLLLNLIFIAPKIEDNEIKFHAGLFKLIKVTLNTALLKLNYVSAFTCPVQHETSEGL